MSDHCNQVTISTHTHNTIRRTKKKYAQYVHTRASTIPECPEQRRVHTRTHMRHKHTRARAHHTHTNSHDRFAHARARIQLLLVLTLACTQRQMRARARAPSHPALPRQATARRRGGISHAAPGPRPVSRPSPGHSPTGKSPTPPPAVTQNSFRRSSIATTTAQVRRGVGLGDGFWCDVALVCGFSCACVTLVCNDRVLDWTCLHVREPTGMPERNDAYTFCVCLQIYITVLSLYFLNSGRPTRPRRSEGGAGTAACRWWLGDRR